MRDKMVCRIFTFRGALHVPRLCTKRGLVHLTRKCNDLMAAPKHEQTESDRKFAQRVDGSVIAWVYLNACRSTNAEPRAVASGCFTQVYRFLSGSAELGASIRSLPRSGSAIECKMMGSSEPSLKLHAEIRSLPRAVLYLSAHELSSAPSSC